MPHNSLYVEDLSPDSRYALIRAHCDRLLAKLRVISNEINELQRDMNEFLEEYFQRVGTLLLSHEQEIATSSPSMEEEACDFKRLSRGMYVRLIRRHHPDCQSHSPAPSPIARAQLIIDAYRSDDISTLWKEYFADIFDDNSLEEATKQQMVFDFYHNLSLCVLKQRKTLLELEQSEENQLRLRVFHARLEGIDLIASIVAELKGPPADPLMGSSRQPDSYRLTA